MHEAKSFKKRKSLIFSLTFILISSTDVEVTPALPAIGKDACTQVVYLDLNDRLEGSPAAAGESICYQLDTDDPGLLMVTVASPSRVDLKSRLRQFSWTREIQVLKELSNPYRLVVQLGEPSSFIFEVAPQDARNPLEAYTLATRFVAESDAVTLNLAQSPRKDGDDGRIKPILIVSPLWKGSSSDSDLYTTRVNRPGLFHFPSSGKTVLGHGGQRLGIPSSTDLAVVRFYDICRRKSLDDHDAEFVCASQIRPRERVHGVLSSSWPAERDSFTFVLTVQSTVQLKTFGAFEVVSTLYDSQGNHLASETRGGHASLSRTLTPGRYFVTIESKDGTSGSYSTSFETSPW